VPVAGQRGAGRGGWLLVVLLTAAYALAMVDRTILVLLIGPLQRDLHLSDTQFGLLQGATFALFYVLAGYPIGLLIDRLPRILVISGGLMLWSAATVLSAFANGFGLLFAARTVVAVGEASLNPAAYSLLSDAFAKARLGRAIGIFSMGAAIGTSAAYLIGGALLGLQHGHADFHLPVLGAVKVWQLAFLVAGAPGVVLSILIGFLREPPRRSAAGAAPSSARSQSWWPFFLAHRVALSLVFCASASQTLLLYSFLTWSPALLLRVHHLAGEKVGLILGLSNAVFGIAGFFAGGFLADRWFKAGRADAHMRVGFWAHCLILPLGLAATLAAPLAVVVPCLCALTFLQLGTGPATIAGLQLMTPSALRGRTSAILMMATTLAGVGLGPMLVGLLNDFVFHSQQGVGRSLACVVAAVCPLAILLFAVARRSVAREIANAEHLAAMASA
jgi:MFS family permease